MTFQANSLLHHSRLAGQRARVLCLCFVVLFPLTGCSQQKSITWREEVKLSNGQIIVAERSADFRNVYAGGSGNGWLFQHARIKATLPPLNKVVMWDGSLEPLALDTAKDGAIYLVAISANLQGEKENSIPEGKRHAAFKYNEDGQWIRIPVESVPREIRPNMLIDEVTLFIKQDYSTSKVLELALKEKLNDDPGLSESFRSWSTK